MNYSDSRAVVSFSQNNNHKATKTIKYKKISQIQEKKARKCREPDYQP